MQKAEVAKGQVFIVFSKKFPFDFRLPKGEGWKTRVFSLFPLPAFAFSICSPFSFDSRVASVAISRRLRIPPDYAVEVSRRDMQDGASAPLVFFSNSLSFYYSFFSPFFSRVRCVLFSFSRRRFRLVARLCDGWLGRSFLLVLRYPIVIISNGSCSFFWYGDDGVGGIVGSSRRITI